MCDVERVSRENRTLSSLRFQKRVCNYISLLLFIVLLIQFVELIYQWRRSTFIEDQTVLLRRKETTRNVSGVDTTDALIYTETISITYDAINRDSLLLRRPTYIFRSILTSKTSPIFRHRVCFGYLSSIGTRISGFVKLVDLIN